MNLRHKKRFFFSIKLRLTLEYLDLTSFTPLYSIPRISLDESNLIITDVNKGDEGNYTCVIKSELEQKSASAHLMVIGTPGLN